MHCDLDKRLFFNYFYFLTTSFLALQILCNCLCHLLNSFRNYVIAFNVYCGNVQYVLPFQ